MTTTRLLSLCTLCALVAACGGGGDSGPAPATPATPSAQASVPLAATMMKMIGDTKSSQISISGTVAVSGQVLNVSGSGTYSESTVAGTFEGTPGFRKSLALTGNVVVNGSSTPLSSASEAYYDASFKPLGAVGPGSYCVTTSYVAPPASAQPGTNSSWFAQDCYASSAKLTRIGSASSSYTVEADGPGTVLVKFINRVSDAAGNSVPSTSTYRVTAAGVPTRLNDVTSFTVSGAAFSLTITYQ